MTDPSPHQSKTVEKFSDLDSTNWKGECELWLDPLGDKVTKSPCTLSVEGSEVSYTWEHEGREHQGKLMLTSQGADFTDSFHSETTMECKNVNAVRGLAQVEGSYGPEGDWGWRIALIYRSPLEQLVLQMTNIAPWGEEARAVRMTLQASS